MVRLLLGFNKTFTIRRRIRTHTDTGSAEEAGNLIDNGSFESNTNGWIVGGTNTLAVSTAQAKFGAQSLLCTYVDTREFVSYALALGVNTYVGSMWLYIPASYDGTNLQVRFTGFTGGTGNDVAVSADMTLTDQWQRVVTGQLTPVSGDLVGSLQIREAGDVPVGGKAIYIDGVQAESGVIMTGVPGTIQPHVLSNLPPTPERPKGAGLVRVDEYRFWLGDSTNAVDIRLDDLIEEEGTDPLRMYRVLAVLDEAGRGHHQYMRIESYSQESNPWATSGDE